jgi:Na+/proline symporter
LPTVISAIAIAVSVGFAMLSGPGILVIWWKKLNRRGGYAGIGSGLVAFVTAEFLYPEIPASFVGFFASLAVAIAVSLLTQQSDKPKPLTMADGQALELTDRLGTLPLFRRVE